MTELVVNGTFSVNTPPSTLANWTNFGTVQVGVGTGVGGTDCFESVFPAFGSGGFIRQTHGQIFTPSTNYNMSCFINVTGAHTFGTAFYSAGGFFQSGFSSFDFGGTVAVSLASPPYGVYVQYTTNFTSSAFTTQPYDTTAFTVSAAPGFALVSRPPVRFDNVSLMAAAICMRGDTMISVKNCSDEPSEVAVKDLDPKNHLVYSATSKTFRRLIDVFKSGPVSRIYEIPAYSLAASQDRPVYLTGGHRVISSSAGSDHECKVRDLKDKKRIRCDPPITVYSIILEEDDYILANGAMIKASGVTTHNAYRDLINI